jgi:hypothetical protein
MIEEDKLADEPENEEQYEVSKPFHQMMYEAIAPKIKQFLSDYFGERFYVLNPETYLQIEESIKDNFIFAAEIPDILYRHRTITDDDQFEEALAKFVPPKTAIAWQKSKNWFDQDFGTGEDEDSFLEDSHNIDLTEEQQIAKKIVETVDDMIEHTRNFAHFMKSGYEITMKEAQSFMERYASFDLAILSAEGFEELNNHMGFMVEQQLEDLEAMINRQSGD